jgi:hypothetical protein
MDKIFLISILFSQNIYAQSFFGFNDKAELNKAEIASIDKLEKLVPALLFQYEQKFETATLEINALKAKRKTECQKTNDKNCLLALKNFEKKHLETEWEKKKEYLRLINENEIKQLNEFYQSEISKLN